MSPDNRGCTVHVSPRFHNRVLDDPRIACKKSLLTEPLSGYGELPLQIWSFLKRMEEQLQYLTCLVKHMQSSERMKNVEGQLGYSTGTGELMQSSSIHSIHHPVISSLKLNLCYFHDDPARISPEAYSATAPLAEHLPLKEPPLAMIAFKEEVTHPQDVKSEFKPSSDTLLLIRAQDNSSKNCA